MLDLYYLSDDNRRLIEAMEKKAETAPGTEASLLRQRAQLLRAQEKHYYSCSGEELYELRAQLYEKTARLARAGRPERAAPFQNFIQIVDTRIRELAMEEARLAELRREAAKKEELLVDGRKSRSDNPAPLTGRNRWTVGFGRPDRGTDPEAKE